MQHDRLYVMQANPNNSGEKMFDEIDRDVRISLQDWQSYFLQGLGMVVIQALAHAPGATINAISTDFQDTSDVTRLAMAVMGLV